MIVLLATAALAQQNSEFVGAGRDCQLPAAIYGTSGWANAQQALDTNASTYSASTFAERLGLEQQARDEDTRGMILWEVNQTYDVARVPTFHGEFGQNYAGETNCDDQYRVGMRPVDLQATLLAGVFGTRHFGGFFAASQTSGQVADADNMTRLAYFGYLYPLYSTGSLIFAPFVPGEYRSGANGFGLDAVYGAWVDNQYVMAKAGYTKSSGLYANARDRTLGLFFTGVIRPGDGSVPVFRGGLQRLDVAEKAGGNAALFGMPSLFYRDIPLAQPVGIEDAEDVDRQRLRTTHARLEDVGRMVDVSSAFRIRPVAGVSEAQLALHTKRYHRRAGEEEQRGGYAFA